MKYFKHDSDASLDAKLKRVRMKYGMEGYGLYWYCLELIAMNVQKHNLNFELEHDSEIISLDTNIHQERVQEMMMDFVKWELFENQDGIITCLKMATRTDEYTQKLMRDAGFVPRLSGQTPESVPRMSDLIEQNRTKQNKRPTFSDEDFSLAEKMYESLLTLNPKHKKPNLNVWANTIRLMRERDSLTHNEIQAMWTWANNHDFWQANILSPATLRKQWDKLSLQRKKPQPREKKPYVQ